MAAAHTTRPRPRSLRPAPPSFTSPPAAAAPPPASRIARGGAGDLPSLRLALGAAVLLLTRRESYCSTRAGASSQYARIGCASTPCEGGQVRARPPWRSPAHQQRLESQQRAAKQQQQQSVMRVEAFSSSPGGCPLLNIAATAAAARDLADPVAAALDPPPCPLWQSLAGGCLIRCSRSLSAQHSTAALGRRRMWRSASCKPSSAGGIEGGHRGRRQGHPQGPRALAAAATTARSPVWASALLAIRRPPETDRVPGSVW
ncbi:hypothetical protein B0J12DRAFT_436692 [Macrophomina phaseolina]|uniref:Uncharacterized protein n=1 Tax=Macrophomina phaseolina TaxID=35725 RepID=A0ABQ8GHG9_9PEZI|nr:hypothetical protein B0J12DRAFT_436692 [Macrophomina phaseolina]